MVHLVKYVEINRSNKDSKKQLAREFPKFYLRSLLPDDMFSKMNGPDRFNEVYFQAFDENIYKIFYDQSSGRLIMVSGDNSVCYAFSQEEIRRLELKQMSKMLYQGGEVEPIAKIEAVATLRLHTSDDPQFKEAEPAFLPLEFARQQEAMQKKVS